MDQTESKTPNPCVLSVEEQDQLRALLKKSNQRTGKNTLPTNICIKDILSTNHYNSGTRISITQSGLFIYDPNGVLVLSMPLGTQLAYIFANAFAGLTGDLNLYSSDAAGQLVIGTNSLNFKATLGGTLLTLIASLLSLNTHVQIKNGKNLYFNGNTTSAYLYAPDANTLRVSINGTDVLEIGTGGFKVYIAGGLRTITTFDDGLGHAHVLQY